jgi:catechol 2,3-dioxygenase
MADVPTRVASVTLRCSNVEASAAWFGADAIFLAHDDYHHHIGANSWQSRGAPREPLAGPGLAAVALYGDTAGETAETPDGIPIETVSR